MFSPKRSRWPPIFFYISDITNSSSFSGKSRKKMNVGKLSCERPSFVSQIPFISSFRNSFFEFRLYAHPKPLRKCYYKPRALTCNFTVFHEEIFSQKSFKLECQYFNLLEHRLYLLHLIKILDLKSLTDLPISTLRPFRPPLFFIIRERRNTWISGKRKKSRVFPALWSPEPRQNDNLFGCHWLRSSMECSRAYSLANRKAV